jgi:hypothetical protein
MYAWMFESRSAFGFLVQTPFGPRKSGMPDSVEIPAPVSATIRAAVAISREAAASRSLTAPVYRGANTSSFLVFYWRWLYQSEAGARYYRARPDVITGRENRS